MHIIFYCVRIHLAIQAQPGFDPAEVLRQGEIVMKRIKTLETRNLCESAVNGGCGECQTSCQSACKTSSGVINQKCENKAAKSVRK